MERFDAHNGLALVRHELLTAVVAMEPFVPVLTALALEAVLASAGWLGSMRAPKAAGWSLNFLPSISRSILTGIRLLEEFSLSALIGEFFICRNFEPEFLENLGLFVKTF